jgi:tetraacyldisaccharide 4'-kinase
MKVLDVLRVLFIPLIPVYALVVAVRNYLFNRGILKTKAVNSFVISIGNLTTGGSGKSPFTIKVTNMLKSMGLRVAVLSRGYGRDAGDEMLQTVYNCEVPAAVCEDRIIGAEELLDDFSSDALVLDDAYQHRYIERDLNIVIFDQRFFTRRNSLRRLMLPTGDLREPLSEIKRADCVIINRKFSAKAELPERYMKLLRTKPVFIKPLDSWMFVIMNFSRQKSFRDKRACLCAALLIRIRS